ncbi:NAD(P)/FAD-dependent oxidoreductase [candidate division KSB1 bacterium]|nr:NAD(P)/FAD-dependent oxidoreductase [candidate division KSB1 bacterium]
MAHHDILIIGAGVTGAAIARRLCRYDLKITLLEKEADVSFGTSKANSGIIHAGFHAKPDTLKAQLSVKGNALFDSLTRELNVPFRRCGELVVAFTNEEMLEVENLYSQGLENGVNYLEIIGRERLRELEPNISEDAYGALYAPTAGIIEPYEYCFALVENAVKNGVELFTSTPVTSIRKGTNGISVFSGKRLFQAQFVVNAAGVFADEISRMAGAEEFRIRPRKGEEYVLDKRAGKLVSHIIFPVPQPQSKGILIIPTVDGTMMIGPTAKDVDDKHDLTTSREGLEQILQHAQKMVPGIRSKDIITSFAGLRPAAEGEDFIIGMSDKLPGFIQAAGIQSPGLTASPAIAEKIHDVLLDDGLRLTEKTNYMPELKKRVKIRELTPEQIEQVLRQRADYGRVVCRCEEISEGEVVDAIDSGHSTMDAIKFATRAGMGRCQGGFCTFRVMHILHQITGVPLEKITKSGAGSEILARKIFEEAP